MTAVLEHTIEAFCLRFLEEPYLCYIEHGMHALFYQGFYNALPVGQRYTDFLGHEVCVVQKEYPTAGNLGKPQRQHWDIALIKTPPEPLGGKSPPYDYLRLAAVVEFGLNEAVAHLEDDIARLTHPRANTDKAYVMHLYRLSSPGKNFSSRDWSANSAHICGLSDMRAMVGHKPVTVYYGIWDASGKYEHCLWRIASGGELRLD